MLEPADEAPLLELRGLTYTATTATLLDDVSAALPATGVTAIIGANGAGKTTLLRLLAGLLTPTAGEIDWSLAGSARRTAMVFQRPVILRRSVDANIRHAIAPLGLNEAEAARRVDEALAVCRLDHLRTAPARRLSGGEQQRLALARALARKPDVLLLDEPCASLDPQSTAAIEAIVRQAAAASTAVVLVTHDIAQAQRLAAWVMFLDAGRLIEHSRAGAFFAGPQTAEARDYLAGRLPPIAPGDEGS